MRFALLLAALAVSLGDGADVWLSDLLFVAGSIMALCDIPLERRRQERKERERLE